MGGTSSDPFQAATRPIQALEQSSLKAPPGLRLLFLPRHRVPAAGGPAHLQRVTLGAVSAQGRSVSMKEGAQGFCGVALLSAECGGGSAMPGYLCTSTELRV